MTIFCKTPPLIKIRDQRIFELRHVPPSVVYTHLKRAPSDFYLEPELLSSANFTLFRATDRFIGADVNIDRPLETYVTSAIFKSVKKTSTRAKKRKKVSDNQKEVIASSSAFFAQHGRYPTAYELSEILNAPVDQIHEYLEKIKTPRRFLSLTQNSENPAELEVPPIMLQEALTIYQNDSLLNLSPEKVLINEEDKETKEIYLKNLLKKIALLICQFDKKQKSIFYKFLMGESIKNISKDIKVSETTVRRLVKQGMVNLKKNFQKEDHTFLDHVLNSFNLLPEKFKIFFTTRFHFYEKIHDKKMAASAKQKLAKYNRNAEKLIDVIVPYLYELPEKQRNVLYQFLMGEEMSQIKKNMDFKYLTHTYRVLQNARETIRLKLKNNLRNTFDILFDSSYTLTPQLRENFRNKYNEYQTSSHDTFIEFFKHLIPILYELEETQRVVLFKYLMGDDIKKITQDMKFNNRRFTYRVLRKARDEIKPKIEEKFHNLFDQLYDSSHSLTPQLKEIFKDRMHHYSHDQDSIHAPLAELLENLIPILYELEETQRVVLFKYLMEDDTKKITQDMKFNNRRFTNRVLRKTRDEIKPKLPETHHILFEKLFDRYYTLPSDIKESFLKQYLEYGTKYQKTIF